MRNVFLFSCILVAFCTALAAEDLTSEQRAKVDAKLAQLVALGSDPTVVKLVKAAEAAPPAWSAAMTQDKWSTLSVLSPEIKELTKGELATYLKTKKDELITEMFVSSNTGIKIAFLAKTTSWSHKGKPKHEVPLSGKTWVGPVETDESTGLKQVQVAFPILDAGKPIASLVVGLSFTKL